MKGQYTFDDNYKIKKARTSVWVIIRKALLLLVKSIFLLPMIREFVQLIRLAGILISLRMF